MSGEEHIPRDRAVVERITDGRAVLHVGEDAREVVVPSEALPAGAGEGDWVEVGGCPGSLEVGPVDEAMTSARRAALAERMRALRVERGGGRFRGR